ncbi:ATP-dependent DNA helicase [Pleurotus pulmonarius]
MRLDAGEEERNFASWLLDVGHGRNVDYDGKIDIPHDMVCPDLKSLTDFIYPGIDGVVPPPAYFLDRTILAARNNDVDDINNTVLDRMAGEILQFISADSIENEDNMQATRVNEIPVEYLRSLIAPGLPPGHLSMKPGCPLILLRNLAPGSGLCNGTRVVLLRATDRVLEVQVMGGQFDGEVSFIPRITLTPSGKDAEFTFTLRRRQFPVRLAFAMTINKAQGQSVRFVGLDLRVPVFTHGQLYVGLSRATSRQRVKILLPDGSDELKALNIVYPEVFTM